MHVNGQANGKLNGKANGQPLVATVPPPCPWEPLITVASTAPSPVIEARTYQRKRWATNSRPALLRCGDGGRYVVKGKQCGMVLGNEHLVGRLGALLAAPVPRVEIINLPDKLIEMEPDLADFKPGLSHGSSYLEECSERECILHTDLRENRARFALLAILYGWVRVEQDHQCIYQNDPPELVYSVDHGHCFPDGPNWTEQTLKDAPPAWPDVRIRDACGLTEDEIQKAAKSLLNVTDAQIAQVVAGPPEEWGYPMRRRVAMARYLAERRDYMVEHCLPAPAVPAAAQQGGI